MSQAHREYFNGIASEWSEKMTDDPIFRDYLIRFVVSSGDCVLDVGAGTGRMTKYLAELVRPDGMVVAEDIADCMLMEGKKILGNHHQHWLCDDLLRLSIKDKTFDKILCFSAFPHFIDPMAALKEMYRVLRPSGKLLILHTSSSAQLNEFHTSLNGVVCNDVLPSAKEMIPLLNQAGFICKEIIERENLYWLEALKPFELTTAT